MFKSLKSKLKSWLGKEEDQEDKVEEVIEDSVKEEKLKEKTEKEEEKPVKKKESKKSTTKKKEEPVKESKKEKISEEPVKEKVTEEKEEVDKESPEEKSADEKSVQEITEENSEVKEEPKKKGFLSRMFSSSDEDNKEEPVKEKPEVEIEQKKEEKASDKVKEELKDPEPLEETIEDIQEEIEEEEEKKGFFSKLASSFKGETTVTQEHVDEIFDDLEMILLENNVALEVVDKIKEQLSEKLIGQDIKKETIQESVIQALKDAIDEVLIEPPDLIKTIKEHDGLYTIIFFGINGSGKTTNIAKLTHKLKNAGIDCVLAAGDTFRAAAIQQLEKHAKKLDVPIIKHDYNSDPTAVAFDAKKYAQENKAKCLLIDTAGRMYTKDNLIKQMEKIIRVIEPDLKIFVGESITGNDGTQQAKTFHEAVGIDGIILSKADVDEKAGTILSVSQVTGKPIYFLGVGQEYEDLQEFTKTTVLKNLGLED